MTSVKKELESVAHRLTRRHGALLHLMRMALYTDVEEPLQGQEARFELLWILEELASRPPIAKAVQCLDFGDSDPKITQAYHEAVARARGLLAQEADLKAALDALYLAACGT